MKLTPKLTPRQRAFLDNLLELYREGRAPVHYSELAKRLGVNRFSAYDMLKVLEKKGLASASYTLRSAAAAQPGPGRSIVVFSPTPLAVLMTAPESDDRLGEEWQHVRELVEDVVFFSQTRNFNMSDMNLFHTHRDCSLH